MPKSGKFYEFKRSLSRKSVPKGNLDGATKQDNKRISSAAKRVNKVTQGQAKAEKPSKRKA